LSSGQLSVEEEKNSTPAFHFLFVIASHDFRFVICNESKAKQSVNTLKESKSKSIHLELPQSNTIIIHQLMRESILIALAINHWFHFLCGCMKCLILQLPTSRLPRYV
jgi:hypothetical protein